MKKMILEITTLLTMCLFFSACKIGSIESSVESTPLSQQEGTIEPTIATTATITATIETVEPALIVGENPFFFKDVNQPVIYRGLLSFDSDILNEIVSLQIKYLADLQYGKLYELKLYGVDEIPEDRRSLGYFYVQEDRIHKFDPTKENLDLLKTSKELPEDSVIVCQEEEIKDSLGENESGWHHYLEVDGDKRVYHSYNNLVSTGYYETFTWELGKGLVDYRSGYAAERDAIELELLQAISVIQKDWASAQSDSILKEKPEYKEYMKYTYELGEAYITVYEGPNTDREDWANYSADIWVYTKDWIAQVEDNTWLLPAKYEVGWIGDKEYFRYDLSYVTESTTVFLMLDDENKLHRISLPGELYEVKGEDITVVSSSYDMLYTKSDQILSGHTWKPQYYYYDNYDVHAYAAVEISNEEFNQYVGSQEILDQLKSKYSNQDSKLSISFLKRENGLIHIKLNVESTDSIIFYYETYQIQEDQSLVEISSGEGTYAPLPKEVVIK